MITRTAQYAVRAVVFLAEARGDASVTVAQVAEGTGAPQNYLSKILRVLAQVRILDATRGPHGGFRLVRPARDIFLAEIMAPFVDIQAGECPVSPLICPHGGGCPSRKECLALTTSLTCFLTSTTIDDLATPRKP